MTIRSKANRTAIPEQESFGALLQLAKNSLSLLTGKERSLFLSTVVLRMAMNGLDLVAVGATGLLGAMTAAGLTGTQGFYIFGFRTPEPTQGSVIALVGGIAFLVILKGGISIWFTRYTGLILATIEIKNSLKVARYLFSGTLERMRTYSRTQIQWVINTSTNAAFSGILGSITTIIVEVSLFFGILVIFFVVDPLATMGVLLYFAILLFVLQRTTARRYVESGKNIQSSSIDTGNSVLEMVDSFREIAVLARQDYFLTQFGEAKKLSVRTGLSLQILKSLPRYIAEIGITIGVFLFLIWQLSRGSLAEGLIAVGIFSAGSFRMMGALLPLQQLWNDLRVSQEWVIMAQNILLKIKDDPELIDPNPYSKASKVERAQRPDTAGQSGLAISARDLSFSYGDPQDLTIKKVSLDIPAGAFAAVVGPSGAGKTTLVDLLLGLHDPSSGEIRVDGEDPRVLREQGLGLVSYVPQRPGLVSGSIARNVALGVADDEVDEDRVREALMKAQLLEFVEGLSGGIHSPLGTHADSLSGGQAQRLGLARALYSGPKLIVLDEATSALDAATEASISSSIRSLGVETTVVVIAHRLSTVQHADVVHVMDDGNLIASGSFAEVRLAVPMIEQFVQLMSFDEPS